MEIGIITLFPEMFSALSFGITGRAQENKLITLKLWNPREFTTDKRQTVDDRPYGGGPGMLMKVQPLQDAIQAAKKQLPQGTKTGYLTPQGRVFNQQHGIELSKRKSMLLVAGRYEGIDERLIQTDIDEEWSIGDFVLSGAELAIMLMIDTITRLLPGALGNETSAEQDSFMDGLLDYPHYTRPSNINGLEVPEILLSGNHEEIKTWRTKQALGRTWLRRPDLLKEKKLTNIEQKLLDEFIQEVNQRKKS